MRTYRYLQVFAAGAAGLLTGLAYNKVSSNCTFLISATPINQDVDGIISDTIKDYVRNYTPIMKHGFPSYDTLRINENFVLSYDRRNRVPNWVMEHLSRDASGKEEADSGVTRNSSKSRCYEDKTIHEYFRSTLADYKGSGYDKGHLAAAANHKCNLEAYEKTNVLSNIAPQNKYFNRVIWLKLENHVRDLVGKYRSVFVCSGPLYLPREIEPEAEQLLGLAQESQKNGKRKRKYVIYEVIGQNDISVPTHFFKVILCKKEKNVYDMEAYIIPNEQFDKRKPLSDFKVKPNVIERNAGFLFFEELPPNSLRYINGERSSNELELPRMDSN